MIDAIAAELDAIKGSTSIKVVILATNLAIDGYMAWVLRHPAEQDRELRAPK